MVQKKETFAIILGKAYTSYQPILDKLNQETLDVRRMNLNLNFVVKCTKFSQDRDMFPLNPNFGADSPIFDLESPCHTLRFSTNPIPSRARLLNKQGKPSKYTLLNIVKKIVQHFFLLCTIVNNGS